MANGMGEVDGNDDVLNRASYYFMPIHYQNKTRYLTGWSQHKYFKNRFQGTNLPRNGAFYGIFNRY